MSASKLLTELTRQGLTLATEGTGIRVTPTSRLTEELRQTIRTHKAELLALLRGQSDTGADDALAEALAAIERAKRSVPLTQLQRTILDTFGSVFRRYHAERNPLLFDAAGDVENQLRLIWGLKSRTIGNGVACPDP